jgi:D-amino-acid dehydrogenase
MAVKKVVIIGAGVIGLTTAYELRRRGIDVVLVDRAKAGKQASHGNAGWITPSLSDPVPAPGLTTQSIRMLLQPDSPFHIRPSSIPSMIPWLLKFRAHCNERDFHKGMKATVALNKFTMPLYDRLYENNVDFEMHSTGLFRVSLTEEEADEFMADSKVLESYGYLPAVRVTGDEARSMEPELSDKVVGGVLFPEERHVRPDTLINGLIKWLNNAGVEILNNESFVAPIQRNGNFVGIRTQARDIEADTIVVAAGAWGGEVARQFGVKIPMRGGIGYSITMENPELKINRSMYLGHARVAVTPFENALRFAGTMELASLNAKPNPRRIMAIRRSVIPYFTNWKVETKGEEWMGIRPMTTDGLPVIGKSPKSDNVFIATGHAMLGVTLATVTGAAVADLITEGKTEIAVEPFSPARFRQ